MLSKKGLVVPLLIAVVAVLAILGAVYFASHEKAEAPTVEIQEVPDKPAENPSFDSGTYPVISSISPATGPVGTVVSLAVSNFTNDAAVYVGVSDSSQKAWNPLSVSTTTITFVIPKDLSVGVHDINIMISTKHTPTSNRVKFTVTPPVNSNLPVACTMDAMMCPDGSYVGRSGPKCEFVCPKIPVPQYNTPIVLSPNGGEVLKLDGIKPISWASLYTNHSSSVSIKIIANYSGCFNLKQNMICSTVLDPIFTLASSTPNTGIYEWKVGTFSSAEYSDAISEGKYYLRICDEVNKNMCDVSDNLFEIR
jgi:hypothetical protein